MKKVDTITSAMKSLKCHLVNLIFPGFAAFKEIVIHENYDLIALPETCFDITPEKTEEMSIPNYSLLHSGRKDDKEGVAFYVKNSIKFKVIDMTESPGPISFEQLLSILKQAGK